MSTHDHKVHIIQTGTLTYNYLCSAIVWTWCLPTLTHVWSFYGIFKPVNIFHSCQFFSRISDTTRKTQMHLVTTWCKYYLVTNSIIAWVTILLEVSFTTFCLHGVVCWETLYKFIVLYCSLNESLTTRTITRVAYILLSI